MASFPTVEIYEKEERVLAHHKNMVYEAKVMNVEDRPDPTRPGFMKPYYQIHYQGWNDRWDEWVDASRLLKFNDDNKAYQAKIRMESKKLNKKKEKKDGGKTFKKRREMGQEGGGFMKVDINIPQPLIVYV